MRLLTWANLLSILRLPLAAAFLLTESVPVRTGIVVAAGLSDFLDGKVARRTGQTTSVGELLDPITDKTFVFAALSSFALRGVLELWQFLALLIRDLYAVAAFLSVRLMRLPIRFRSRWSGKVVTTLQGAAVVALLYLPESATVLTLVIGAAGLWAVMDYTRAGLRSLRGAEHGR